MNKYQKLVQQQFLNDEETVIKRLEGIYNLSLKDITGKLTVLDSDIGKLQKAYNSITDDEIGDLAAAFLGSKANFTPEEAKATLQSMIQSKVYQKKYQEGLKKQVGDVLDQMQDKQFKTVSEYLDVCYENGFIGTMYDLQGQGIPMCFPLDQEQMVRAVQLDSKISNGLYTKLGEDVAILKGKITAEISRGISTGASFQQIAQQLAGRTKIGYTNAVRIARTEGHRIQVQAGMDACYKAKDMGADVVKQWDSTLDGRTRHSHAVVDGEIRELDEKFSNGLRFPGDPHGAAAEVVNCRCALLQRARWALDDDELQTLQDRASFFGLDKTANFDDYKSKYLQATQSPAVQPKKEYLTKKKLEQKIAELEAKQALLPSGGDEWQKLEDLKVDYQDKLDKKVTAAEIKKLKKAEVDLQDQLDHYDIKTYSNIWKNDVTTDDWQAKQAAIPKKKAYFQQQLQNATDPADIAKWQGLLDDLDDFDQKGKAYFDIKNNLTKTKQGLTKLKNGSKMSATAGDAFTQDRKDAAYWFTSKNGGTKAADAVLRDKSGEVWRNASRSEQAAIYEYTRSYHKFNEPLRGIEYGTNKFLGVGNVDLNMIGVNSYGGFKPGEVKKQIDGVTSIIEKSSYDFDIWLQRGVHYDGMDKFFGIDRSDFYLPEADLAAKLIGTTPTEYGFMSTACSKGKGFSGDIILNIYAPKGTKMMYVEPFSAFGNGSGMSWDGVSKQYSIGGEAEVLLQRDTKFRVTKVEKTPGMTYIDMEIIDQGAH